jgi:berberine-like enzyme
VFSAWQEWAAGLVPQMWTTCKLFAYPGSSGQIIVAGAWIGSGSVQNQLAKLLAGTPAPTSTYHGTGSYGDTMLGEANCSGETASTCIANGFAPANRETFTATSSVVPKPMPAAGVAAIIEAVAAGANVPQMTAGGASFDVLGGTVAEVGAADTAVPWRTALATVQHTAQWNTAQATTINPAAFNAYVRSLRAALTPWCGTAAYVNYADPGIADYATAYWGANLPRLKQVKQTYDPTNLFSFPQSVPLP